MMKKFTYQTLFFLFPIILIGISLEILLRRMPNDYKIKSNFLATSASNTEVLILGNSHSFAGINPDDMSYKAFNASCVSQSLDLDEAILKKYEKNLPNLKTIVVPLTWFSLNNQLRSFTEDWRMKNYALYYKLNIDYKFTDRFELLSNSLKINCQRFWNYYVKGVNNLESNSLGWGTKFISQGDVDLMQSGKTAAQRHTISDSNVLKANSQFVNDIIDIAKQKNSKVLFFTPPAHKGYIENLDLNQEAKLLKFVNELCLKNANVRYENLLRCNDFIDVDYCDADHLNKYGAKKLTHKIDSIIITMR